MSSGGDAVAARARGGAAACAGQRRAGSPAGRLRACRGSDAWLGRRRRRGGRRWPAALPHRARAGRLRSPLGRDRGQRLTRVSVLVEPHIARRLLAAGAAAVALLGLLLVLLVATLMGGLVLPRSCGPGAGARYAPSAVALADIPGNYLRWIRQAGDRFRLDWTVLAGIYSIETDFGRLDAPGVRSGENAAGAGGPGQFLAPTWRLYGVDGDDDGVKDRYDPADAIPGTANLLARSGAPSDYRRAIFAYNHASWYVDDVLSRAARYRGAAEADPNAVQAALVADASANEACGQLVDAGGPADLGRAVRLAFPAADRAPPRGAVGGR